MNEQLKSLETKLKNSEEEIVRLVGNVGKIQIEVPKQIDEKLERVMNNIREEMKRNQSA